MGEGCDHRQKGAILMAALMAIFIGNVCARLVIATSTLAATGVGAFLCRDECSPGAIAVNLRQCRLSDADVHALGGCLDSIGRGNIQALDLGGNEFISLPGDMLQGLTSMTSLRLDMNDLQTLPAEVFQGLDSLVELDLRGNPDLKCVYSKNSPIPVCESSATGREVNSAPPEQRPRLLRGREIPNRTHAAHESRELLEISQGVLGLAYDVQEHVRAAGRQEAHDGNNAAIAPAWDSTACMTHWGRPELVDTPDPNGYVIFVDGREQLGGTKLLISDGLLIARALGRTLVEYPVKDSRIVGFDESPHGFGIYWDATELCMYNRILDLKRFRMMTMDGRIPAKGFVTFHSDGNDVALLGESRTENDIIEFFKPYSHTQVIVMERMWKRGSKLGALQYLRPNPFYAGVVRTLVQQQEDWGVGEFVAVQWRTETSTRNLTECYEEVKNVIEEQRTALGYGVHQVFINTDLVAGASGTYKNRETSGYEELLDMVERDYPSAFDNSLYSFTSKIEDTGVRSIVTGLATSSAKIMVASSLNDRSHRTDPGAFRCQKVDSAYILLIAQWRQTVMGTAAEGVYRIFPFGTFERYRRKERKQPMDQRRFRVARRPIMRLRKRVRNGQLN